MSDQSKIFNLYENNLNQSAIASMQQRDPAKNLKYRPSQGKPSYGKYGVPTTSPEKIKSAPYVSNIHMGDEEMELKGYGVIDSEQASKFLERVKDDIHNLIEKNVTGLVLKSKLDLYTTVIEQMKKKGLIS